MTGDGWHEEFSASPATRHASHEGFDLNTDLTQTHAHKIERKHILYLALFAVGFFLLVPQAIGFQRALELVRRADARYLALALVAETLRYVASAGSSVILARLFARRVPLAAMTEAFFAGGALNRTFSTGGAPGMIVRLLFFIKQGLTAGQVVVVFMIENVAGFLVAMPIILLGVAALLFARTLNGFASQVAWTFALGSALILLVAAWVYYNHPRVERAVLWAALGWDALFRRFLKRPLVSLRQAKRALDDFYTGLELARQFPLYAAGALLMNLLRNTAGYLALYFAFLSLGADVSLPALILFYTSGSILSTVSAVPGEMLLVGTGMLILSLSFGVPSDLALIAILLSRTVTFWLPLPVGYAALWHLHREKRV